jgi:hypothetical protein
LKLVLALTIFCQLILHIVYGPETFLYAPQFGPLLVIFAALGSFTRARRLVLTLTTLLIIFASINNAILFKHAASFYDRHFVPTSQISTTGK